MGLGTKAYQLLCGSPWVLEFLYCCQPGSLAGFDSLNTLP